MAGKINAVHSGHESGQEAEASGDRGRTLSLGRVVQKGFLEKTAFVLGLMSRGQDMKLKGRKSSG